MRLVDLLTLCLCLLGQGSFVVLSSTTQASRHSFFSLTQTTSATQSTSQKNQTRPSLKPSSSKNDEETDAAAVEAQRRVFAVSIIMSLTDEARKYKDLALSARVLARAADALWDDDPELSRTLLRRAWEAAEKADAPDEVGPSSSSAAAMLISLPRKNAGDSRSEVLSIAARRDRALADDFLAKLIDAEAKAAKQSTDQSLPSVNDSWTTSEATSKRISFAQRLLDENEAEKAFAFAAPVLDRVNEKVISFLSRLRLVQPALADKQFMLLLARAEIDPTADANTVSGLSSYAFTPGLYVTFSRDGGVRWMPALETISPPDLPQQVRTRFFRTAANILLRPSPMPDQDLTSAGISGKYLVIKRLLPLFEQYAPVIAVALQSQLTALAEQLTKSFVEEDDFLLTQGIARELDQRTVLEGLQERADRAKDERARDEIYADAAAILASRGNRAAQDIADRIDNAYRREMARRYVDISLLRMAVSKKDVEAALQFANAGSLTHSQRTWAYLQIARLLMNSNRERAIEFLEEAVAEARRIDDDDANRAGLIIGVANQFFAADIVRCWEVAAEANKAANAIEGFSGEPNVLSVPLITNSGLKLLDLDTSDMNLATLVNSLAKQDLARASDFAKSFRYEAPRAVAILAVARSAMEKRNDRK